ncbi:MAG: hypothetical protein U5N58_02405 [Actinomycetota bacterium]|nr:hypothetical protein [Actinomycetota bacterium]
MNWQNLGKDIVITLKDSMVSEITGVVVGIVEIKGVQENIDNLLKNASLAADYVTGEEAFGYRFFDRNMEDKLLREEYIKSELKKIIK